MLSKYKMNKVLAELASCYPDAKAELDFENPFELLVATVLSAQCTDVRVNKVTKILFDKAPDAAALDAIDQSELEDIIKPCGLYKSKAKNLKATAHELVTVFNGKVPEPIETLMTLPGVGKKTANVVASNAFGTPAIAVDTHVFRVSNRLGLASATTVEKTEEQLMQNIPRSKWTKMHHMIIFHGRRVCKARKPACELCTMTQWCEFYKEEVKPNLRKKTKGPARG